jgi:hypothetical protein
MAATGGAETAYFFDEHEFTSPPFFSGVRVSQSLVFCEFFFVSFSFDRYIVYIPRIMELMFIEKVSSFCSTSSSHRVILSFEN